MVNLNHLFRFLLSKEKVTYDTEVNRWTCFLKGLNATSRFKNENNNTKLAKRLLSSELDIDKNALITTNNARFNAAIISHQKYFSRYGVVMEPKLARNS